jgi:hypothetical protein
MRMNSWIRKIQELKRLKMEPWRIVDACNGSMRAQKWSHGVHEDQWSQIFASLDEQQDPDPH